LVNQQIPLKLETNRYHILVPDTDICSQMSGISYRCKVRNCLSADNIGGTIYRSGSI